MKSDKDIKSKNSLNIADRISGFYSYSNELTVCWRELSALYKAGISLPRSFEIMVMQVTHPKLKKAFTECMTKLETGRSLSNAMASNSEIFPEIYIRMIDVGVKSGNLDRIMEDIARHSENKRDKEMKLRSALIYPIFIFAICLAFLIIGPAYMFNGILEFLRQLNVELPLATKFLISASSVIRSPFFPVILLTLVITAFLAVKYLWNDTKWRKIMQNYFLTLPGVGPLVKSAAVAQFSRTLAIVYDAGLPILQGIDLAGKSSNLITMQEAVKNARDRIAEGEILQTAIEKTGFFPPVTVQLLSAGEESGKIGDMLNRAAQICEENVDQVTEAAISVLQPIILLIIGVIVGFVVIATIAPMLNVIQNI